MAELSGTKTHENLKAAFTRESEANRRYLWFAQQADIEGRPEAAALFRAVAEGETSHAFGHLEYLVDVGDPASGGPIGETAQHLRVAIAGEIHDATELYPGFAQTARDEGLDDIADWFESIARDEHSHAARFTDGLEAIS
jgi:rubrerythrin